MTAKKQTAIAYYRVSSEKQRQKESIDSQKIEMKEFVKEKKYKVIREFQDDGISGESIDKRAGFQQALDYLNHNNVDALLVYMVDRIGRFKSRKDRNTVIELLESTGTNVDGPYMDRPYRHDSEDDMNALEADLNESRRENRRRAANIKKGLKRVRLKGGYAGGNKPYGVEFDKQKRKWFLIPQELHTVKVMLEKLSSGWGYKRTADYFNQNPKQYPKRVRNFHGKPVTKWSDWGIRNIIQNDFYFTGIIQPIEKNRKKGSIPVDTGFRAQLFPKDVVMLARREASVRRARYIDANLEDRKRKKRKHAQQGETVFTDALLHGLARCHHCGWKLGLQPHRKDAAGGGQYTYFYYLCRNRYKKPCDFRHISVRKLDPYVWNEFIKVLSDPDLIEQRILNGEFLMDKDRDAQKSRLNKAEKDLKKYSKAWEKTKNQYRWEDISEDEYQYWKEQLRGQIAQTERDIENYQEALNQPEEVKEAVKAATKILSQQVKVLSWLNQLEEIADKILEIFPEDSEHLNGKQMKAMSKKAQPLLDKQRAIAQNLKRWGGYSPDDLERPDIEKMIYQQKRLMLQRFIDFDDEKGIRVRNANDFKEVIFNFSIGSLISSRTWSVMQPP